LKRRKGEEEGRRGERGLEKKEKKDETKHGNTGGISLRGERPNQEGGEDARSLTSRNCG